MTTVGNNLILYDELRHAIIRGETRLLGGMLVASHWTGTELAGRPGIEVVRIPLAGHALKPLDSVYDDSRFGEFILLPADRQIDKATAEEIKFACIYYKVMSLDDMVSYLKMQGFDTVYLE